MKKFYYGKGKELEFPEGREGVRGNQGFPLFYVTRKNI
jgi:hypothetical protein